MNGVAYKDSHTFPGGLRIDYDSELLEEYILDRDAVYTQKQLAELQNKWKYLLPELYQPAIDVETFIWIRSSRDVQNVFLEDKSIRPYLNLIAPLTLFKLDLISAIYGVTIG